MVGTSDLALEVCVQQPLAHMSYFASLDNEPPPMLLLSLNPGYIHPRTKGFDELQSDSGV